MTRAYVPASLRRHVIERAKARCEYCLFPQAASLLTFEIEHIVPEKHGGATLSENLALACPYCNRYKGSDLGSLDPDTGQLVPFFDPRTQRWDQHFALRGALIAARTPIGRVTVAILQLNHPDRVLERESLIGTSRY